MWGDKPLDGETEQIRPSWLSVSDHLRTDAGRTKKWKVHVINVLIESGRSF